MLSLSETESAYVDGAIRPEWARLGYDYAAGRRGGMADLCIGTGEASRLGWMIRYCLEDRWSHTELDDERAIAAA
jgi:hypothetical protein